MKKNRIKTGITAIFGIALTFLSLSCSPQGTLAEVGAPSAGISSEEDNAIPVRMAAVELATIEDTVSLSGEVSATGVVMVLPETSGLLTRLLVSPGDYVVKDQIIAWVDPSKPGMAYSESPVKAKAAGTVTSTDAVVGNQVSPQTVIAQVGNLQELEIDIHVPERYLGQLNLGMDARITSRAFPDTGISAGVVEISPVVDPRTRTVAVTMVPESGSVLRAGQSVTVDLILESRRDVTTVPDSAVVERSGQNGVFIVSGSSAEWRPVESGISVSGLMEISGGLEKGEMIVVAGVNLITDGSLLKIIES